MTWPYTGIARNKSKKLTFFYRGVYVYLYFELVFMTCCIMHPMDIMDDDDHTKMFGQMSLKDMQTVIITHSYQLYTDINFLAYYASLHTVSINCCCNLMDLSALKHCTTRLGSHRSL